MNEFKNNNSKLTCQQKQIYDRIIEYYEIELKRQLGISQSTTKKHQNKYEESSSDWNPRNN